MTRCENPSKNNQPYGKCEPVNVFLSKTVEPLKLRCHGTAKYAIVIENYSPRVITDVTIKDPALSSFLSVSNIRLNGAPVSDTQNLYSGVFIPCMPPLSGARVTFDASLLPGAPCRILNVAEAAYHYHADGKLSFNEIKSDETALEVTMTANHS